MSDPMSAVPMRVNSIRILGNERTHSAFIERELLPATQATNLSDVIGKQHEGLAVAP